MTDDGIVRQEQTLFLSMLQATYWFDDALQENLEASGIGRLTRAQSFVIANVAVGERHAIKIARNLGVTRQAISQILMELERQGYIATEPDPDNRRARLVRLSTSFEKHGAICARIFRGLEDELEARIGKGLVQSLRKAFAADWGDPPRLTDPRLRASQSSAAKARSIARKTNSRSSRREPGRP